MKKNQSIILVIFLASLFLLTTSLFIYKYHEKSSIKWGSPDETANYYFTKKYATLGTLSQFEKANLMDEEVVRPRSIRSDHGWLKPVSFLGIIIYFGFITSFLGIFIIPYLTPLIAFIAIIYYYLLIKKLFNYKIAILSTAFLSFFPVYLYYSARSMFHNVLFTALLIISFYYFNLSCDKKYFRKKKIGLNVLWSLLAGLFLGGAIATRTSELIWLLPSLFVLYLFYFRRISWRILLVLSGIGFAILPIAYYNQLLYGFVAYGGYGEMNSSIDQISQASSTFFSSFNFSYLKQFWQILQDNIFYFGLKPRQSLDMFYYYVLVMFPYLSALSFLGGLFFLISKIKKWRLVYLLNFFIVSSILVLYYGSWQFFDNPDPSRYTIGNSYTRYWLPIYILAIPLASYFIVLISNLLFGAKRKIIGSFDRSMIFLKNTFLILVISFLAYHSLIFVFFGSEEGLIHSYYNHRLDLNNTERVLAKIDEEAIVVTQYHDKQFFPERKVIVALLNHNETNRSISKLIDCYPIYYYNFTFREQDMEYLNNRKLLEYNLNIEEILKQGDFSLYKFIKVN